MTNIQSITFDFQKGDDGRLDLNIFQDIVDTLNNLIGNESYYVCEKITLTYGNVGKIYINDFPNVKFGLEVSSALDSSNMASVYSHVYINDTVSEMDLGGMDNIQTNTFILDYFKTPDGALLWGVRLSSSSPIYLQFASNVPFLQIDKKEKQYKDLIFLFRQSSGYGYHQAGRAGTFIVKDSTKNYYLTTNTTSYYDNGNKYYGANSFRASSKGFELVPFALPSSSGSSECYSDKLYINLLGPDSSTAGIVKSDGLYYLRLGHYFGFKIYYLLGPALN